MSDKPDPQLAERLGVLGPVNHLEVGTHVAIIRDERLQRSYELGAELAIVPFEQFANHGHGEASFTLWKRLCCGWQDRNDARECRACDSDCNYCS